MSFKNIFLLSFAGLLSTSLVAQAKNSSVQNAIFAEIRGIDPNSAIRVYKHSVHKRAIKRSWFTSTSEPKDIYKRLKPGPSINFYGEIYGKLNDDITCILSESLDADEINLNDVIQLVQQRLTILPEVTAIEAVQLSGIADYSTYQYEFLNEEGDRIMVSPPFLRGYLGHVGEPIPVPDHMYEKIVEELAAKVSNPSVVLRLPLSKIRKLPFLKILK